MKSFACLAFAAAVAATCPLAFAAQSVSISNLPLPVTGTVNANVTNTALNPIPVKANALSVTPYQSTQSIVDSLSCPSSQCTFNFPAVPGGKRLIVESVSAQMPANTRTIVFEKSQFAYFVGVPSTAGTYINASVKIYYEAGEMPGARIAVTSTASATVIVTIVGTLVPAGD